MYVEKNSKLLEIAPKIIAYASQKRRPSLELRNLIATYKDSAVDLEEESLELQSKHNLKVSCGRRNYFVHYVPHQHYNNSLLSYYCHI